MTNQHKRPTFEISIDTRMIYDRLKKSRVGDVVTYEELTKLVGRDVTDGAHGNLYSARRRLLREDQIVFDTVRKIGLQRLGDTEIVEASEADLARIRRAAKRAGRKLTCVQNFAGLQETHQTKHNAAMSLFAAVATITKQSQVRKIEAKIGKTEAVLPLAKTLAMFT